VLVLTPPAQAVMLLGEVRELEIEGEGAEDVALTLERERSDGGGELRPWPRLTRPASGAREAADPLDVGE
jgi:hypothetical protein